MAMQFPGAAYNADGDNLERDRPPLNQATLDMVPVKSMVSINEIEPRQDGYTESIGRVWLLRPGTKFHQIPAPEIFAARGILRAGGGVLLLAMDRNTETEVRGGLEALIDADLSGRGRFGHA